MKLGLFAIGMCLAALVEGQTPDTTGIHHTLDSLLTLSGSCIQKQELDKGLELNAIAEKIALEQFGRNSAEYAKCCFIKGKLYLYKADYKETENWYLEYNSIMLHVFGKNNIDYAWGLDDLAQLYNMLGEYEKAEPLYFETKSIIAGIRGTSHPDYAWILNDLAIYYRTTGYYEKAEPLYLEAKSIREKTLGIDHPDYAWSLNNLANLYNFMGSYEKAEPYFLAAINLWKKLYGKESTYYATGTNNLASLYFNMGAYKKAEPLLLESSALRAKLLGKENPDYAGSLNNLAGLYMEMGSYKKAEPYYLESKAIREKIMGKEHPEYANVIGNLGILYNLMHDSKKAELYFLEAQSIWENSAGVEHPDYATCLFNLANFYLDQGQLEKAEALFLKSLNIREKLLGAEHPDISTSLKNLANLYVVKKQIGKSIPLLEKVFKQTRSRLALATTFLSENELSEYINKFQNQENELGTCLYVCRDSANCELTKALHSLAYDHALFYKGFLISEAVKLKTLSESTPESREIYLRLKSYRRRLSDEYSLPINQRTSLEELEAKANTTEKELARAVSGYADRNRQVQWTDVQNALQKNEAAIEFVHFDFNFPKVTDSVMYVALLIKNGIAEPILISLFEEESLDSLLQYNSARKADYVNGLYTLPDRGATIVEKPKSSLYELLWKPIEKHLAGINTIYFSPTGLLHRINHDAIPISDVETLADKYQLIMLNSTRQLVIPNPSKRVDDTAMLYGGIQFERDSLSQSDDPLLSSRSRGELAFSSTDQRLRGGTWSYLPGTEREINSLEKILQNSGIHVITKKGSEGTEESFKNIGTNNHPSPRVLHIASHGYFFPDARQSNKDATLDSLSEPVFKISAHPMLRSGLIMAGGNAAWKGKQDLDKREDGILTAYEISQMNLSNTELVVLSACETGLGDIQGNEGVYGLQRAFKIAGVKYIIMSLWQVPDKQTSMLMTAFYKKWLEGEDPEKGGKKMTIPNAFHAAQKVLRDIGLDPYQWAGFVLVE